MVDDQLAAILAMQHMVDLPGQHQRQAAVRFVLQEQHLLGSQLSFHAVAGNMLD